MPSSGPPDPSLRADGRCLVCGGPRRMDKLKPLYRQHMESDPFCSTQCAREWWGTSLPAAPPRGRGGAYVSAIYDDARGGDAL